MATVKQLRAILRAYKNEHKINYSKLNKKELLNLIEKLGLSHLIPEKEPQKRPIYTEKKYKKLQQKLADVYKRLNMKPI